MISQVLIDLAIMAGRAYQTTRAQNGINWFSVPEGWTEFSHVPNSAYPTTSGFEGVSFQRGTEIVISYAGTDPGDISGDMAANLGLGLGFGSDQLVQAAEYYLQVQAANPNATISFAGHSLGGGLAALMGVFFGKRAVTFDQAPFAQSATPSLLPGVAETLLSRLLTDGYSVTALAGLTDFLQRRAVSGGIPNSDLVTSINVQGELLSGGIPWNITDRIGLPTYIPTNAPGVSGTDLHSQALLTAFLQSMQTAPSQRALNDVTFKLADLTGMIFDENLFERSTGTANTTEENFLERLIRHEVGMGPGLPSDRMVSRFTSDLWKLAQDGGLTMTDGTAATNLVSKTLIAFAMQMYYADTANAADKNKELFTDLAAEGMGSGGIQFDRANAAPTLDNAKGYNVYFQDYLANTFPAGERQAIQSLLPAIRDWYVQAGGSGMEATDSLNRGAFMLGGDRIDTLTGGSQDDLLVGNAGADRLTGVGGNDVLLGGAGFDTYLYATGDGNDRIEDSDAAGAIKVNGQMLVGGIKKAGHTDWVSTDGTIKYLMSGTDLVVQLNGATIMTINENFQSGQFGIQLIDRSEDPTGAPPVVNYTNGYEWEVIYANQEIYQSSTLGGSGDTSLNYVIHGYEGEESWIFNSGNLGSNQIFAVGGDDVVATGWGPDRISGGSGNDILWASAGDDVVQGDEGDDVLKAGTGRDFLDGGVGNDIVLSGPGKDVALGGDGSDILYGDGQTPAIAGAFGPGGSVGDPVLMDDDYLDGQSGSDWLFGFLGDDVLVGGEGADHLFGDNVPEKGPSLQIMYDSRTDFYGHVAFESSEFWFTTIQGGSDYLDGGDGKDFLRGDGGNDVLLGGNQDDELIGDDGNAAYVQQGDDMLDGGAGNDLLLGGGGSDVLIGGEGSDQLCGDYPNAGGLDEGHDILVGGGGDDLLFGGGGDDVCDGGNDSDELQGGIGNDTLFGGSGNDRLFGDEGDDRLFGEEGDDELQGGEGNDSIVGDAGNDQLLGSAGLDELFGGDGNDTLTGGDGSDILWGGDGDDQLRGENGDDVLSGGSGNNTMLGGAGDDEVLGGIGNDELFGGSGHDRIEGGVGIDYLEGGEGNDTIYGGVGDDRIYGDDNPNLAPSNGPTIGGDDFLDGDQGNDDLRGGGGNDTLLGGSGNDLLLGGDGDDVLQGGVGNDTLRGEFGVDVLYGEEGNDSLYAGSRAAGGGGGEGGGGGGELFSIFASVQPVDRLYGDDGDDYLNSGNEYFETSDSLLVGGGGNDTFVIDGGGDTVVEEINGGIDTVETFVSYTLPDHVENLTFAGLPGLVGAGNALDNVMRGLGQGTLDGRAGNDTLIDAQTYHFGRGDGHDTIVENDPSSAPYFSGGPQDTILMAADIAPADVGWRRRGNDLVLTVNGTMDEVTLESYFTVVFNQGDYRFSPSLYLPGTSNINVSTLPYYVAPSQVEQVQFADGTVWGAGTFGAAQLGSYGSNVYAFGRGDGQAMIVDFDFTGEQPADVLRVNPEVSPANVTVRRVGDNLVLGIIGTDDQLTIESHFASVFVMAPFAASGRTVGAYQLEQIQFADGTVWDAAMIASLVPIMGTEQNDVLQGTNLDNVLVGLGGHDTLQGLAGNDRIEGSLGNDTLIGGDGHDTYLFSLGDGTDTIEDVAMPGEENRIQFGAGIMQSDLIFTRNDVAGTLTIQVGASGTDQLVLTNFDPTGANGSLVVKTLAFTDGSTVSLADLYPPNQAPTVAIPLADQTVSEDAPFSIQVAAETFTDADVVHGDVLTYRATLADGRALPAWLSFDPLARIFSGTPVPGVPGTLQLTVTAIDSGGLSVSDEFTLTISGPLPKILAGTAGDDVLIGARGDDTLSGLAGSDRLQGGEGHDVIDGGFGADTMIGGTGDDTYVVENVFDVVTEAFNEGTDTVQTALSAYLLGANVENLTLTGTGPSAGIGNALNNTVLGNAAANLLFGGNGNDVLLGGAGNDGLDGGTGADTLIGGIGSDVLIGGSGNDLYRFFRGDGQDVIRDQDATVGNHDRLVFGETINPLDLVIERQANDLRLRIHAASDSVLITRWYSAGTTNHVETIQAGNGQTLLDTQVDQLIQAMAVFTQQSGLTWDQAIDQRPQDVGAVLAGSWQ